MKIEEINKIEEDLIELCEDNEVMKETIREYFDKLRKKKVV